MERRKEGEKEKGWREGVSEGMRRESKKLDRGNMRKGGREGRRE